MYKEDLSKHLDVDRERFKEAEEIAEKLARELAKELLAVKHRPIPLSVQDKVIMYPAGYLIARIMANLSRQPEIKEIVEYRIKRYQKNPHWENKLFLEYVYMITDALDFRELFDFYTECRDNEPEAVVEKWFQKVPKVASVGAVFIAFPVNPPIDEEDEDEDLKPAIF